MHQRPAVLSARVSASSTAASPSVICPAPPRPSASSASSTAECMWKTASGRSPERCPQQSCAGAAVPAPDEQTQDRGSFPAGWPLGDQIPNGPRYLLYSGISRGCKGCVVVPTFIQGRRRPSRTAITVKEGGRNLSTRMRHQQREFSVVGSPHPSRRTGSVKANVAPCPTRLFTQIRPPCSSTNLRHRASPSPVPSTFLSPVPTCRNSSKITS